MKLAKRLGPPGSRRRELEEFHTIPGFPDYKVNQLGMVLGKQGKILQPIAGPGGYPQVNLYRQGMRHVTALHRIVLWTFHGPKPKGYEARHLDGNKTNYALANLVWGTKEENFQDRHRHGTWPAGSRNGRAKLTEEDVINILQLCRDGANRRSVAKKYGISPQMISWITTGGLWRHVRRI